MAHFVIAGKSNCLSCTHALHVAEYLSNHLPHFRYRAEIIPESDWPYWLDQLNSINNWNQTKSPVIWKHIGKLGGRSYLIGGLGEFWEYCYDYYGFQSQVPSEDLTKIMQDNELTQAKPAMNQLHNISIIGAANHVMLQFLIYELQSCITLKEGENVNIRLYDTIMDVDIDEEDILLGLVDDLKEIIKYAPQYLNLVTSPQEAIENCDLLIVIEDYNRKEGENIDDWLERCRTHMLLLAEDVNAYAKRDLRIVLSHFGPVCFNASVLMKYCTRIKLANIVAVTADEGISIINFLAKRADELVENFWCPPVWGFCGLLSYIALANTVITSQVIRPYKRALTTKENTKLPKGEIQSQLRMLEYYINIDDTLYEDIEIKKEQEFEVLQRDPILPKIRALGGLLKLWFADEINDDIISLGICSNGAYGFPSGTCFSQAVYLNENRIWTPVPELPLYSSTVAKLSAISLQVESTLEQFELGKYESNLKKDVTQFLL